MRKILLTQGKYALVDDADFVWLPEKWCFDGRYAVKRIDGKKVYLHRLLMDAGKMQVDHADGNRLNNQRNNLRVCTHSQNKWNQTITKSNRSGYKGVSFHKHVGKWRSRIQVNNVRHELGWFSDLTGAARAYNRAAKYYYGEFAKLNPA